MKPLPARMHWFDDEVDAWSPSVADRLPAALPAQDPMQQLLAEVQRDRRRLLHVLGVALMLLIAGLGAASLA